MNLLPEEQILIKDIFAVTLNKHDSSASVYLPEFIKEVSIFGRTISHMQPMLH